VIAVRDRDAKPLGRVAVKEEYGADIAYSSGFVASGRAYVVLTAKPGSRRTKYRLVIQDLYEVPPPPPPPCDPRNWDARNPSCADVCNFKHPDLHSPRCCDIMRPCSNGIAVGKCAGKIIAFSDGFFTVKVGRADAGVDFLSAHLVAPIGEPQVFSPSGRDVTALDHQHWLSFVSADEHSSVWRLGTDYGHDVAWLGANATHIEIIPPPICRGGDYVPRRP